MNEIFGCGISRFTITAAVLLSMGCSPKPDSAAPTDATLTPTSIQVGDISDDPALASLKLTVPENISKFFKRKCYVCHSGPESKGGFDLKTMTYRADENSDWQPMDLAGVTRIKFAILPINGKPPRMPKRAGSILNSLTRHEANTIAQWTDFPYRE